MNHHEFWHEARQESRHESRRGSRRGSRHGSRRGSHRGSRHESDRRPRNERGTISVWFATAALVMTVLVGMTVDLGGKVHTQQRTRSVAAEAARTGAQEIQGSTAMRGEDLTIDTMAAKIAAQNYLRAAGVDGTVTVTGGDTLEVRTTDTYHSKFLTIIGLDAMQVTGGASARLIRAEGGIER